MNTASIKKSDFPELVLRVELSFLCFGIAVIFAPGLTGIDVSKLMSTETSEAIREDFDDFTSRAAESVLNVGEEMMELTAQRTETPDVASPPPTTAEPSVVREDSQHENSDLAASTEEPARAPEPTAILSSSDPWLDVVTGRRPTENPQ